jgi:TonB family protein
MKLTLALLFALALWPPGASPARQEGAQGCEQYADRVYTHQEVDQPAKIIRRHPPAYPRGARRRRAGGSVKLQIVLRPDGRVTDIEVLETSDEMFNQPSVEAAKKTKFEPAIKGGCPVAQSIILTNTYNIY